MQIIQRVMDEAISLTPDFPTRSTAVFSEYDPVRHHKPPDLLVQTLNLAPTVIKENAPFDKLMRIWMQIRPRYRSPYVRSLQTIVC